MTLNPFKTVKQSRVSYSLAPRTECGEGERAFLEMTVGAAAMDFGFSRGANDEHTRHGSVRREQQRLKTKDMPPEGFSTDNSTHCHFQTGSPREGGASQTVGAKDEQSHFLKSQHHLSPPLSPNKIGGEGERDDGFVTVLKHFKRHRCSTFSSA